MAPAVRKAPSVGFGSTYAQPSAVALAWMCALYAVTAPTSAARSVLSRMKIWPTGDGWIEDGPQEIHGGWPCRDAAVFGGCPVGFVSFRNLAICATISIEISV